MEFVKPNLPERKVNKLFISRIIDKTVYDSLINLGTEPIFLEPTVNLHSELRFHPDILTFNISDGIWLAEKQNEYMFDFCKLIKTGNLLSDGYPNDCIFNMVSVGKRLICGKKGYTDEKLFQSFDKVIHVKQSYTKCSTAVLDDESFITGDPSVYKALKENNFNILKVTNKGILLNGFSNGFIGGCCGKLDKNILAFTGRIED
ncbi:hypothetical protein EOM82_06835, partial [bacterium]|nr:hypothetical protein [bacterium]